eukprot:2989569-Rhodomonas_salina.1
MSLLSLPKEVLVSLLAFLDTESLLIKFPAVCTRFSSVCKDSDVVKKVDFSFTHGRYEQGFRKGWAKSEVPARALLQYLSRIRHVDEVDARSCDGANDTFLEGVTRMFPGLKGISVEHSVEGPGLVHLARCQSLTSLTLHCCRASSYLTDALEKIMSSCPLIAKLDLRKSFTSKDSLRRIAKLPVVELYLDERQEHISFRPEALVPTLHRLNLLQFLHCQPIDDTVLEALGTSCPHLHSLHAEEQAWYHGQPQLSDRSLSTMAQGCTKLESLKLTSFVTGGSGIHSVATSCPFLRELSLRVHSNGDAIALALAPCHRLQELQFVVIMSIANAAGFTDAGMAAGVASWNAHTLRTLRLHFHHDVDYSLLSQTGASILTRCVNLEELQLPRGMPLHFLQLVPDQFPSLVKLRADYTPATNEDLLQLSAKLPNLKHLKFTNHSSGPVWSSVSAEGYLAIARCTLLEVLEFDGYGGFPNMRVETLLAIKQRCSSMRICTWRNGIDQMSV